MTSGQYPGDSPFRHTGEVSDGEEPFQNLAETPCRNYRIVLINKMTFCLLLFFPAGNVIQLIESQKEEAVSKWNLQTFKGK